MVACCVMLDQLTTWLIILLFIQINNRIDLLCHVNAQANWISAKEKKECFFFIYLNFFFYWKKHHYLKLLQIWRKKECSLQICWIRVLQRKSILFVGE